jgi:hypothetical protein
MQAASFLRWPSCILLIEMTLVNELCKLPVEEKQVAYYEGVIETRQNAWHHWESHPRTINYRRLVLSTTSRDNRNSDDLI